VAAHGDFACTAAMQLAKPLKLNPRQVAERLRARCSPPPLSALGRGHRDRRPRLHQHPPEARRQAGDRARGAGRRRGFGVQPANGEKVLVEFVSANPTGPLHVGHGRQAALGDAICNLRATQGESVWREFYYNDAGVQIQTLATSTQLRARGFKPGDAEWPPARKVRPTTATTSPTSPPTSRPKKTVKSDDREVTASGDVEDIDSIRQFAVAYLRHEQDLDLQAFSRQVRQLLPGVQPVHQRPRRGRGARSSWTPARPTSRTARCG
jgi:arginyl-tRNA synthetase